MKLYGTKGEEVVILWGDHQPSCETCREVDLSRSATFAKACAQGSPLLMEELAKRQAPIVAKKRKEVEEWAKERGTFIKSKVKDARVITKYKEPQ